MSDIIITPDPDKVTIEGREFPRPSNIPPSRWLEFWEGIDTSPSLEEKLEQAGHEIDDLKSERDAARAETEELRAQLKEVHSEMRGLLSRLKDLSKNAP